MKTPVTAKQLNHWLQQSFMVIEGPPRAYLELPFEILMNGRPSTWIHRVTFISLGLRGAEEDCVTELVSLLISCTTPEVLIDGGEPLFIRTPFSYEPEDRTIYGRLAFWREQPQFKLMSSRCYKPEGFIPRDTIRKE